MNVVTQPTGAAREGPFDVPSDLASWVVEQACRAPSIHNTQPWRFRSSGNVIDLFVDPRRELPVADPDGRFRILSCGAALFTARLALRSRGFVGRCSSFPSKPDAQWLARLVVEPAGPATVEEGRLFRANCRRHTHRTGFAEQELDPSALSALLRAAETESAHLRLVGTPGQRNSILALTQAAGRRRSSDPSVRAEIRQWTAAPGSRRPDGVPAAAYLGTCATVGDQLVARDFDLGRGWGGAGSDPGAATLAVLVTDADRMHDWLTAGQALQRVLLTAASRWVFAAIDSQVIELVGPRTALRRQLSVSGFPQLLLRFGYAGTAPSTPRRPLTDVLEEVPAQ